MVVKPSENDYTNDKNYNFDIFDEDTFNPFDRESRLEVPESRERPDEIFEEVAPKDFDGEDMGNGGVLRRGDRTRHRPSRIIDEVQTFITKLPEKLEVCKGDESEHS